jgi:hypothetical protein
VGWDTTTPVNIIISTDGSVTLGVGYHIWVVATEDEDILLQGGRPDDGDLFLMQSYRSELGGVAAGLEVLGALSRLGLINIASATFLCDNESTVVSTNRPLSDSIFHRIEGDHDLVSTIKDLKESWFCGLVIMYDWVKGHADDLNRELNRAERFNVIADGHCDTVRQQASGPRSARSSAGLWDSETCALFIRGSKITSHMKEILTQELLDGDLEQACSSGRCRTVGGSTGVRFTSICLPWVFTTMVLTIVAFPTHPPYGWVQVWKPHFPIESKYGVLAPRSAIKIQQSGTSRRRILWLSVHCAGYTV